MSKLPNAFGPSLRNMLRKLRPATLRIEESRNLRVLLAASASYAAVDLYVGRTNFKELKSQGLRPFAVGAIGEVPIAVVALAMVLEAVKVFLL